jgi:GxxExxY protein
VAEEKLATDTHKGPHRQKRKHFDLCISAAGWLKTCPYRSVCVRGKKKKMEDDKLTYEINGAVFEVNRLLGAGFLEKVYENALLQELRIRGLKADNQIPISVRYKDIVVGEYFADIVVEDRIIIEIKAVDRLMKIHDAQILNYLKATTYKVGLLINFTYPKAEIKRFVF